MGFDGSLNFDTNVNTKGFSKGIDGIKNKLNGVKSAFSEFSAVITATFSTAAIVGFGKSLIESAAAVNASNSQMKQTFGNFYGSADEAIGHVAETSESLQSFLKENYANDAAFGLSCTETTGNVAINTLSKLFGWENYDSEEVPVNISESVSEQNELTEAVEETTETQKKPCQTGRNKHTFAKKQLKTLKNRGMKVKKFR